MSPRLRSRRILRGVLVAGLVVGVAACAPEPSENGPDQAGSSEPVAEVSQEIVSYDCATHQDTGYTNGTPFPITVVTVDGEPVELQTANSFLTMAKAAEGAGITLRINSGFRTNAEQAYLYGCYQSGSCNNGNLAAPPGYSNHQSGHALDLNTGGGALAWLNANGGAYGWKRTVPSEDWHWEWWGGGPVTAYCGCTASPEVCDGKDNDCNGQVDEGEVCEQAYLNRFTLAVAPPTTTDVNGDGRADVCARAGDGVHCWFGTVSGGFDVDSGKMLQPLSDASGWLDPSNYATLRMGDIDGDGRADLCARGDAGVACWTSKTSPLGTAVDGPAWSDGAGWAQARYYTTIRLADIDGDGRDDLCARGAGGIVCHKSTDAGFGPGIDGPPWSDGAGFTAARYYGTLAFPDIDGDHRADICVRGAGGISCALSTGDGFGPQFDGPAWSDANGWGDPMYWGSIRFADVDGDGKDDICARNSARLDCHFSTGAGFGPAVQVDALSNASGWSDVTNYQTIRVGDIDGDGAADLCARGDAGIACWAYHEGKFVSLGGPAWGDSTGWNIPPHYETLRLADVDGDGRDEICARASVGVVCTGLDGSVFGPETTTSILSNDQGWSVDPFYGGIFLGTPRCRPTAEVCNGEDDDCDGQVDEGGVCAAAAGGAGGAGGAAAGGASAAGGAGNPSASGGAGAGGEDATATAGASSGSMAGAGGSAGTGAGAFSGSGSGGVPGDAPERPHVAGSTESSDGSCSWAGRASGREPASALWSVLAGLGIIARRARARRRR